MAIKTEWIKHHLFKRKLQLKSYHQAWTFSCMLVVSSVLASLFVRGSTLITYITFICALSALPCYLLFLIARINKKSATEMIGKRPEPFQDLASNVLQPEAPPEYSVHTQAPTRIQYQTAATAETDESALDNNGETDAFFEVAPMALVLTDTEGVILRANTMAHELFQYENNALLNQYVEVLIPEASRERHRKHRSNYMQSEAPKSTVLKNSNIMGLKRTGEVFSACVNLLPFKRYGQEYIALAIQDTTEQKAFERSLEQAKSRAEYASQAKSEFVANMSHEIRTPLNAVLGSAQLLENSTPNPVQKQYIQMIRSAGESLLAVINDILDFSKIESGQLELVETTFSLDEVLTRVGIMMAMNIGEKPIVPVIDIDPTLPPRLIGDPLRLQQVLINLVSNAIKFTQQGEVILSISPVSGRPSNSTKPSETTDNNAIQSSDSASKNSLTESAQKHTIHFSVRDTGIGIKSDQLSNLFKAFSQADSSITRRFGGTGLGLVISNRLVGLMGSAIEVSSTYGEGSTFHFTIGLGVDTQVTDSNHTLEPPPGNKNVLLIEKHQASARAIKSILQAANYAVQHDDNVDDCLQRQSHKLTQTPETYEMVPDIALLNWESCQPSTKLNKLLHNLKDLNSKIHVLFTYSSNQQEQPLREYPHVNYEDVIPKPFTGVKLLEKLTQQNHPAQGTQTANTGLLKKGTHVLLVEDTVLNQTIANQMLEDMGVTCDIANNGSEAIKHYIEKGDQYDVILMDIQMPIMDGVTATQILRKEHQCKTPIIAMTAGVLQSEQQAYIDAGMNALVAKPIDHKTLFQTLAIHSTQQSQTSPNPTSALSTAIADPGTIPGCYFEGNRLEILINGKPDRIKTMQSALLKICDDATRRLANCKQLLVNNDFERLKFEIHSLKGLVANYGGMALKRLFEEVEELCLAEDKASDANSSAVASALTLVQQALASYVADAQAWVRAQSPQIETPRESPSAQHTPVNADLLSETLRTQLLEALDKEAFDEIKDLLASVDALNEKAHQLALQIDDLLQQKDADAIVNLLRAKTIP